MKVIKFENVCEGKDIYVDDDATKQCSLFRICDNDNLPDNEQIEEVLKKGLVFEVNVLKQMEFLENKANGYLILNCSYDESFLGSVFLVYFKVEIKGEIERVGRTKFYINSNEKNHRNTPHFHIKENGDTYSFNFNGEQLAGKTPRKDLSIKIKKFLSYPDTQNKLIEEWNKNIS